MGRVVVVGSLNMDLIVLSPRIPAVGETILGHGFRTAPGGKGANQAVAAARLGAQVSMVGSLGTDSFAESLEKSLDASGVERTFIKRDAKAATGVALITVDDDGQNSIVVASGANFTLTPEDVQSAESVFEGADVLLLQLEVLPVTVLLAASLGRKHGVKVVLNPAPARPLEKMLLEKVDYLIPNETEAELLTGLPVTDVDEAKTAARKLRQMGAGTVILTLGEKGSLLVNALSESLYPAFKVKAVDTTAAGDAFLGGFAAALSEGISLDEAVRWGNAAGGLSTTQIGAQPSLPLLPALKALLKREENG